MPAGTENRSGKPVRRSPDGGRSSENRGTECDALASNAITEVKTSRPRPGYLGEETTVSEPKPSAPPAAETAPQKAAVIRKLEAAKETAHERLMRKHLPAWVISGAVNIGVVALAMLVMPREATPQHAGKVVATSIEKDEDTPEKDLTNEDPGLQSNLEAALPEIDRIEKTTVDAAETK